MTFWKAPTKVVKGFHSQVQEALPESAHDQLHPFEPGDQVLIKSFSRKNCWQPRWTGPYQVLLVTHTTARVEGKTAWIHTTHCKLYTGENGDTPPQDGTDTGRVVE